jgi:putative flippase GtrA
MRDFVSKLLRYGVTGGIAAIVDAGGFALLLHAGLSVVMAGCLSFCIAALVNYRLSSRFVFDSQASLRGFASFLAAALVGLAVNVGVTLVGVFSLGLPPIAGKLMGIGIAFIVNFLINLRFVFHTRLVMPSTDASGPEQGR